MTVQQILPILSSQKEELKEEENDLLINRFEESQINIQSKLAQVVIGVRRSGKSTICKKVLKEKVKEFAYVNFDDERLANLKTEELDTLLEALYRIYGDFKYLFLDEIQNINGWQLFVSRLLRQKIHMIITGSNSRLLSNELTTHLTGRHNKVSLFPFSFAEYCSVLNVDTTSHSTKAKALRKKTLEQYMSNGGFPELMYERNKTEYINGLLDAIINTDIAQRYKIRHKEALRRIASYLSDNYCSEFVAKNVAKEYGVSDHTAENYYNYLKQAYLLIGINRFSFKSKDRIRNEKIYVVDTALATDKKDAIATNNLGWRLENIVCIELLRRNKPMYRELFYFKDNKHEVDFVVTQEGKVIELVQVSYDITSAKTRSREINGLLSASRQLKCDRLTLITFDAEETVTADGKTIEIIPAIDWLCRN